jgi:hypothetical protein
LERDVVRLHVLHDLSLRECGRRLGVSHTWAPVVWRSAEEKLRAAAGRLGLEES